MAGLTIRDLRKSYGEVTSVDGVSLDIQDGEVITLLGSSGCGKTTTLRIIAGLVTEDSGVVEIAGKSMRGIPPWKRDVGIVFQNYALFPHMTVRDNIAYGLKLRRLRGPEVTAQVDRVSEMVEIGDYLKRYPRELSGGQQQRVAVARALAIRPKVLLMDEPLSGLDANLRTRVQQELVELHRASNTTTIYVTHDQHEAFVLADRVALMRAGRIEQLDEPMEVYNRPTSLFSATFMGSNNRFTARVAKIDAGDGRVELDCGGVAMLAAGREGLAAGQAVDVVVRMGRVRIRRDAAAPARANAFPARVREVSFSGGSWRFVLGVGAGDGLELVAEAADADYVDDAPPTAGASVTVEIDPDHVWAFPRENAEQVTA
ncbi:MAG TPA: ABC transporter ATP-binding protein [Pseudolysinimonas sp.]|jgi:ABC-type Fe3+/spermidine/putrescine transport system ATPase subunit